MSSELWNCPLQEEGAGVFVLQFPSLVGEGLILCAAPHCSLLALSGLDIKGQPSLHTLTLVLKS